MDKPVGWLIEHILNEDTDTNIRKTKMKINHHLFMIRESEGKRHV